MATEVRRLEAAGALAEVDEVEAYGHAYRGVATSLRVLAVAAVATLLLSIGRQRQRRSRAIVAQTPAKKGGGRSEK